VKKDDINTPEVQCFHAKEIIPPGNMHRESGNNLANKVSFRWCGGEKKGFVDLWQYRWTFAPFSLDSINE